MENKLVSRIGELLKSKGLMLVTAESCTGGQIAQVITSVAGSSNWFERGFVTYSNQAKRDMLGVTLGTLDKHGAVSAAVAQEMAEGALRYSQAQVSLAVTGIAGPAGGTPQKPVGTLWFAWSGIGLVTKSQSQQFKGERNSIREQAVVFALQGLIKWLQSY